MDNIGKGAGLGSHSDGAFERFLTAAIATIITIMFSWRLLEEQQNQTDNGRPQQKAPLPKQLSNSAIKPDKNDECEDVNKPVVGNSTCQGPPAVVSGVSNSDAGVSKLATSDGSGPEDYCVSDDDEDSSTWANYSWEDDMYGGVHTRRTARDFISSARSLRDREKNSSASESSDFSPPLSSQMLEEMYVNSEYRSALEEADNAMHLSDSSDEDDEGDDYVEEEEEVERDEGEFSFPPVDDSHVYCPQTLAPIIEEDSDDEFDESDESETETDLGENANTKDGANEEEFLTENSSTGQEVVERSLDEEQQPFVGDLITTTVTEQEKQQDRNLNVNETESKECAELDSESDKITVHNRPENLTYLDSDDVEITCDSPVRTCAIDDDDLSDESCSTCSSSASVMTVVSVSTWESNKAKEKVNNQPSSQACSVLSECEKVKDPTNQSLLAFIHNTDNNAEDSCKSDLSGSPQPLNNSDRDLKVEVRRDLEVTIPVDLHRAASGLDYDEFVKSINDQSEFRQSDEDRNETNENGRLSPIFAEEIRNNLAFDNGFDDDIEPREYNPFEDDFCDLSEDSDDSDSFFMVVGNNGHLRNFETVTNLNIAGLSQPCEDLRTLMHSPNQALVFSRTEDISIEHRSRYFTRERNVDTDNSAEYLNNINEIDLVIRESDEVLSECLVITESAYPPADDGSEEAKGTEIKIERRSEEELRDIDEKTRLLNEANIASTNIDLSSPDNTLPVQTENILSYTTASSHKDDENQDSRDSTLMQRTEQEEEGGDGSEGHSASGEQTLHISEKDLIPPETHTPVTQQHSSLNEPEKNKHDKEETNDKTDNCNDTVAAVDHLPNLNENVSLHTYPDSIPTLEINSELTAGFPVKDFAQIPGDQCMSGDDKVLDANCNVRDLLPVGEETVCCDTVHSVEERIPKSDSNSVDITLGSIDSDVAESDLEIMKRSKPIDQTVYDYNLEIWNKYLDKSASSRVARPPLQKPSSFRRDSKGVKARLSKQLPKRPPVVYESILLAPVSEPDKKTFVFELPKNVPLSRQKIFAMRQKFLSQESLAPSPMHDKFASHKASLTSIPRTGRYKKRDLSSSRNSLRHSSTDKIDHISSLYSSRLSCDESFEKRELHSLHENCMFSPHIHQEILNTTESIDNLNSSFSMSGSEMMRYSSMASLVETDIDTGETTETLFVYPDSDFDYDFDFQSSIKRAHSMSELGAAKKPTKKTSRGRFADRNVAKSKSLQTLETNIDDVFTAKGEGNLTRVPSVHELRVSKSLQKLNVPDWFKNSSVSRSGSTFSLYGSQQRRDSTSTMSSMGYPPSLSSSACQSPSQQNTVIIRTRVTPPSAKFFRGPKLPMTPEKAPISPASISLPSDKFRNKEKPKELMPIPIVPFSQLRLMFEKTSDSKPSDPATVQSTVNAPVNAASTTSPTRPKHIPIQETKLPPSILKKTTPVSSTNEDRSPMQLTEHFSNGELNHEPYKQRKPAGADRGVSSPQNEENDKIHKEETTSQLMEIPDGSIPRGVQPKNVNNNNNTSSSISRPPTVTRPTPAPRQPKPAVSQSAQSRKETTV